VVNPRSIQRVAPFAVMPKPGTNTSSVATRLAAKRWGEYFRRTFKGILSAMRSATIPPPRPITTCEITTDVNDVPSLAKSPSEAERNMSNPNTISAETTPKSTRSTRCFFMSYPTRAMATPVIAKIIERIQYRIVTLYDGHPIASKW